MLHVHVAVRTVIGGRHRGLARREGRDQERHTAERRAARQQGAGDLGSREEEGQRARIGVRVCAVASEGAVLVGVDGPAVQSGSSTSNRSSGWPFFTRRSAVCAAIGSPADPLDLCS